MYYIYKWVVDFRYKDYHFKWDTEALPSMGKIAVEVLFGKNGYIDHVFAV